MLRAAEPVPAHPTHGLSKTGQNPGREQTVKVPLRTRAGGCSVEPRLGGHVVLKGAVSGHPAGQAEWESVQSWNGAGRMLLSDTSASASSRAQPRSLCGPGEHH